MELCKEGMVDQVLINNNIMPLSNITKLTKGTVKIQISNNSRATGFFIKLERNKKPFYSLMTNQHVITPEMIQNKESIVIYYKQEELTLILELNKEERIIHNFEEKLDLDITVIEIIPKKDNVKESYFLLPYIDYNEFDTFQFEGKKIQITQFPEGSELSHSDGQILNIYNDNINIFFHNADTKGGSSGSPIVLYGDEKVLAIHKAGNEQKKKNAGIFIKKVVEFFKNFKKNGISKDYYENGSLKYEGEFSDDEYNGKGKFYYPNGDYYIGQFEKGKKHGFGIDYYKNGKKKYEGKFEEDEYKDQQGAFYFENGEMYIGQFQKGKKNGQGMICKDGKIIKEGFFVDDELRNSNSSQNNYNNNYNNINDTDNNINNNNINNNYINNIDNSIYFDNNMDNINNDSDNDNNNDNNNIINKDNKEEENKGIKEKMIDLAKTAKKKAFETMHYLGQKFGFNCWSCHHLVENHTIIEDGLWYCTDCPKDNNICKAI